MLDTSNTDRTIAILGCRGVPARHGGFETFAEHFALYLAEKNRKVRVYCQVKGSGDLLLDTWRGVERVNIYVANDGPWGTIFFDWLSLKHACKTDATLLILGYNTAIFLLLARAKARFTLMNMDGIEWKRQKWSPLVRVWFYLNEIFGCLFANKLIADHPEIANHLSRWAPRRKIITLPYGADAVTSASELPARNLGLVPNNYLLVIARPEPENSLLEIVRAFTSLKTSYKLVMLGEFKPEENDFHRKVLAAGNGSTVFPGALYDAEVVTSLRVNARAYLHGHQVGGTNPSLVEAMGCGSAVIAHDNRFNRWVAGESAHYFSDEESCKAVLSRILDDDDELARMRSGSIKEHAARFTWKTVLEGYELACTQ